MSYLALHESSPDNVPTNYVLKLNTNHPYMITEIPDIPEILPPVLPAPVPVKLVLAFLINLLKKKRNLNNLICKLLRLPLTFAIPLKNNTCVTIVTKTPKFLDNKNYYFPTFTILFIAAQHNSMYDTLRVI